MVNTIEDIQKLVLDGFSDWGSIGDVKVIEHGGKLLFNYRSPKEWNAFESMSRGLMINKHSGVVIARPFDKFFNWFEKGRKGTGHIKTVTEKMDGSMGIIYRDFVDDVIKVATRGSFVSDQAVWATEYLNKNYDIDALREWVDEYTFIVEIIYPDNRIIVDYGDQEKLVLLGVRHIDSGEYMEWHDVIVHNEFWGFEMPSRYSFGSLTELLKATGDFLWDNNEGWVVEMSDGSRWKFKTDRYLGMSRVLSKITPKNMIKYYLDNFDSGSFPLPPYYEEYKELYDKASQEGRDKYGPIVIEIDNLFHESPKDGLRKEFALWVKKNAPHYSAALFDLYDDKDPSLTILNKYVEW